MKIVEKADPCTMKLMEATFFNNAGHFVMTDSIVLSYYRSNHPNDLRAFCHYHGMYNLPTDELIAWLKAQIGDQKAIEIGCGNGAIGRALGIPFTDAKIQDLPAVQLQYALMQQPCIKYPDDVEKLDGHAAIKKYKPDVVIGSWITAKNNGNMYGVSEEKILNSCKTYIHIGNEGVKPHHEKFILNRKHETYKFDWLFGRGDKEKNVIWVWRKS
jgi:hypothetical protein